jgi:hypothetical protein
LYNNGSNVIGTNGLTYDGATLAVTSVNISNTTPSTSTTTGALTIAGGMGVGGTVFANNIGTYQSDLNIQTNVGGIDAPYNINVRGSNGFAPGNNGGSINLYGGGSSNLFGGNINIFAGSSLTANNKGGNVLIGGGPGNSTTYGSVGISTGSAFIVYTNTGASSTSSGALQVIGGAGIGQDLYVGGAINAGNNINVASGNVLALFNSDNTGYATMGYDGTMVNISKPYGGGGNGVQIGNLQRVTSGSTVTCNTGTEILFLDYSTSTINVTLPPNPVNGQSLKIGTFSGVITGITFTPGAGSSYISGTLGSITESTPVQYAFYSGTSAWFRVG